ncbi:hypothetical protein SODG_005314 [Sodalis praecaptivus]
MAVFAQNINQERREKALGDCNHSPRLAFYPVDVTDGDSVNRALDDIEQQWGTPDCLVNNAGIDTQPSAPPEVSGPFEHFPLDVFRKVVEVNLVGTFLMTQQVGGRMKAAGKQGSIINIGSIYGVVSPVQDIYSYKKRTPACLLSSQWPIVPLNRVFITYPLLCDLLGAGRDSGKYPDDFRRGAGRSGSAIPEKLYRPHADRPHGPRG